MHSSAKTLPELNREAVAAARKGQHEAARECYDALLANAAQRHLTHQELHTCYYNRASSLLQLGKHHQVTFAAASCPPAVTGQALLAPF